jgi:hypothetical protein
MAVGWGRHSGRKALLRWTVRWGHALPRLTGELGGQWGSGEGSLAQSARRWLFASLFVLFAPGDGEAGGLRRRLSEGECHHLRGPFRWHFHPLPSPFVIFSYASIFLVKIRQWRGSATERRPSSFTVLSVVSSGCRLTIF